MEAPPTTDAPPAGPLRSAAVWAFASALGTLVGWTALVWAPPAGSLDDVFVVLADARAWRTQGGVDVEASTSALAVLLEALLQHLGLGPEDPLRRAGLVGLGWLACAAAAAAVGGLLLAGRRASVAVLTAMGISTAVGVADAAAFRLEGPLHLALWTLALVLAGRRRFAATLVVLLPLALVRPEALLLVPFVGAFAGRGGRSRLAFAAGLGWGGAVCALRFVRHGAIWPNTYYAKASDSRLEEVQDGLEYTVAALRGGGGVALLWVALGAASLLVRARAKPTPGCAQQRATVAGYLGLAALALAVLVLSGGDGYGGARLFLPLGPPLWLALAASVELAPLRVVPLAVGASALALQLGALAPSPWPGLGTFASNTAAALRAGPAGLEMLHGEPEALRAAARALGDETLAFRHAQRARWFAPDLDLFDVTGLTDAEVARLPHAGPNTFGRNAIGPALERGVGALHLDVGFAPVDAIAGTPIDALLRDGQRLARLHGPIPLAPEHAEIVRTQYLPASRPAGRDASQRTRWFNLFVRADLAERFRAEGFRVGID